MKDVASFNMAVLYYIHVKNIKRDITRVSVKARMGSVVSVEEWYSLICELYNVVCSVKFFSTKEKTSIKKKIDDVKEAVYDKKDYNEAVKMLDDAEYTIYNKMDEKEMIMPKIMIEKGLKGFEGEFAGL